MSKLANQWIELFRAGDFGDKGKFTAADVQKIVDSYKPEFHEAPLRIGHTDDDKAPAYGWLESVRRVGNVLEGKFKQVVPAFAEAVESGSFKKRSIGLKDYGKGLTIRHVAFLGAVPPECKGLADIAFSVDDKDVIEIEFSEEMDMADIAQVDEKVFGEQMKKLFAKMFGNDKPVEVKTFSEAEVKQIAIDAAKAAVAEAVKPFELKFSERETALATTESSARAAAAIGKLKSSGRWVPAFDKMGVSQLFAELAKQAVTIEFGEGAAKVQKAPLEILADFMESLPKIVPSGDIQIPSGIRKVAPSKDARADALHIQALEFAEKHKVEYGVAQLRIIELNPELVALGGASAGAA